LGETQPGKIRRQKQIKQHPMIHKTILASLVTLVIAATSGFAQDSHKSGPFQGPKANTGYVTHTTKNGNSVLTLSDDFKARDTPDPHWQIVDSNENAYLLQKLSIKGGKMNRKIRTISPGATTTEKRSTCVRAADCIG
jgi:hypothetical protein